MPRTGSLRPMMALLLVGALPDTPGAFHFPITRTSLGPRPLAPFLGGTGYLRFQHSLGLCSPQSLRGFGTSRERGNGSVFQNRGGWLTGKTVGGRGATRSSADGGDDIESSGQESSQQLTGSEVEGGADKAGEPEAPGEAGSEGGQETKPRRRSLRLSDLEGYDGFMSLMLDDVKGLEMRPMKLKELRTLVFQMKRDLKYATAENDFKEVGMLKQAIVYLEKQDPLSVVDDLLSDALMEDEPELVQELRKAKNWIMQNSFGESMLFVDRLVCLGPKGENIITVDPDGGDIYRFLDKAQVKKIQKNSQIQQPVWSSDGTMVAFTLLKGGRAGIEESRIMVYDEEGDERLNVPVKQPPFFLMWAPDNMSLTYLSNVDSKMVRLTEILISGGTFSSRSTKSRKLAEATPLFYAFTKKSKQNANMVVHSGSRVYTLDLSTGEEVQLSRSPAPMFMAPSTHTVGGKDAVLLVEKSKGGGHHLVTALTDGTKKKRLYETKGFSTFSIAPDGRRVVLMQQDLSTSFYNITLLEGETGLDPHSDRRLREVELPIDRVMLGFFFSPDSTKLLCLATLTSKDELAVARSSMRMGFQLKFQWIVYDLDYKTTTMLEEFSPRPFFAKVYLPYFDMYAQGFTPWAPDSRAFTYVTADAAYVQNLPPDCDPPPKPLKLGPNMEFVSWSFC